MDGDLSGLAKFINSFMSGAREFNEGVPEINVEELMRISGLDSISALGQSSIETEEGFRNKLYLHAPNGLRGFLSLGGDEAKPFEVLQLAPSGSDFVIQQEVKLKTFYNEVVLAALGGSPKQVGTMPLGPKGMALKMMVDGMMKQPLPPGHHNPSPFAFTAEKLMNDLDTKIMVIIDVDPSKMMELPMEGKDLFMPKIEYAILVDNLGWIAGNFVKLHKAELAKGASQPLEVIDNENWIGLKLRSRDETERMIFRQYGLDNAMLAHHRPSGKLILSSSKEFAAGLFSQKPKLASDPVFLAKTKGLPMEGTAIGYHSPVVHSEFRKFIKEAIEKEFTGEDRYYAMSLLDFFLPEGAQSSEVKVITPTEKGLLSVANSYGSGSKVFRDVGLSIYWSWISSRVFEPNKEKSLRN